MDVEPDVNSANVSGVSMALVVPAVNLRLCPCGKVTRRPSDDGSSCAFRHCLLALAHGVSSDVTPFAVPLCSFHVRILIAAGSR